MDRQAGERRLPLVLMSYALAMVWHDRVRYLPAVLAVALSGMLIVLQSGILLGIVASASTPIDRGHAQIWLAYPGTRTADVGVPIPSDWQAYLAAQPEVDRTETLLTHYVFWQQAGVAVEMCSVVGSQLGPDAIGAISDLTPDLRERLREPGTGVIDEGDRRSLGVAGVGHCIELGGCRVKIVGFVRGLKNVLAVYLFCSLDTARSILRGYGLRPEQTTYVLAHCRAPHEAERVVRRLRGDGRFSVFTAAEFSRRSRWQWLTRSNAGLALSYTTVLGLVVGAVITSQTLAGAVNAAIREWAVLEAVGVPTKRMVGLVLAQSLLVGTAGVTLAVPLSLALGQLLKLLQGIILLPPWLVAGGAVLTLLMSGVSGMAALRTLRLAEPEVLLR